MPIVREYQAEMKENSASQPTFSGLEGFIAGKVIIEGLRRAGKDLTREKFLTALESMENFDVGGYNVNFSPNNHSGSRFVDLTIIRRDGKFGVVVRARLFVLCLVLRP